MYLIIHSGFGDFVLLCINICHLSVCLADIWLDIRYQMVFAISDRDDTGSISGYVINYIPIIIMIAPI